MVAVALPKLARAFGIGRGHAAILITVYLAAMLLGQPLAGRVADAFGTKRVVMISLVGFATCSTGAAFSPTFRWLVTARGLQAVFASALAPSVQSMLRSLTAEEERGHSFGVLGSVIGVGAASGPIVGGALVGTFGWKSIFLANLPVTAIALGVLSTVKLPSAEPKTPSRRPSAVIERMLPALDQQLPIENKPMSQSLSRVPRPNPLRAFISAFIRAFNTLPSNRESRGDREKSELLQPAYLAAVAAQALSNLAQYSLLLIAPIVLDHRGWGSGTTGLALSALTLGLILMSPAGGRFGDRTGRRRAIIIGFCLALVATAMLVPFDLSMPPAVLIAALALFGLGLGFASPSILAAGLSAVSTERSGAAAGLLSASRYVGSIVATLLLSAFVADNGSGARVLYVASGIALVAAIGAAGAIPPPNQPSKH